MNFSTYDIILITIICNCAVVGIIIGSAHVPDMDVSAPILASKSVPQRSYTSPKMEEKLPIAYDEIDRLLEEYIPAVEEKPVKVSSAPNAEKKKANKGRFYIMQEGDNPWKIAKKFHLSYEKLLAINGLDAAKAKNLKIGQKLRIQEES